MENTENNQTASDSDLSASAGSARIEWKGKTCGECAYFTGEECDGCQNEGCEMYDDSDACDEFEPKEAVDHGIYHVVSLGSGQTWRT